MNSPSTGGKDPYEKNVPKDAFSVCNAVSPDADNIIAQKVNERMNRTYGTKHDVPCEDCGSKNWQDWTLLPHKLFNETCTGGNGYLCFDCYCKRRLGL